MQSINHISEKLKVSPTLDPFLGMCRIMRANLRTEVGTQSPAHALNSLAFLAFLGMPLSFQL